jgi:acyl-CoA synthetase (AMP-forming)/AMP-acid ligase II
MSLWAFLEQHVERTPNKPLLLYKDLKQTYAEVLDQSVRAARVFHDRGVKQGDTVCLMLRNSPDYLYAWFGL